MYVIYTHIYIYNYVSIYYSQTLSDPVLWQQLRFSYGPAHVLERAEFAKVVGLLVALNGLSLWASFIFLRLLLFPAWLSAPRGHGYR